MFGEISFKLPSTNSSALQIPYTNITGLGSGVQTALSQPTTGFSGTSIVLSVNPVIEDSTLLGPVISAPTLNGGVISGSSLFTCSLTACSGLPDTFNYTYSGGV